MEAKIPMVFIDKYEKFGLLQLFYGFRCKHERITASTQLCDIAYQAKSGELVLDCTNVDKIPEKPEPEVSEVVFMITLVTLTNKGFCRNASYVSKRMMENNISIAW